MGDRIQESCETARHECIALWVAPGWGSAPEQQGKMGTTCQTCKAGHVISHEMTAAEIFEQKPGTMIKARTTCPRAYMEEIVVIFVGNTVRLAGCAFGGLARDPSLPYVRQSLSLTCRREIFGFGPTLGERDARAVEAKLRELYGKLRLGEARAAYTRYQRERGYTEPVPTAEEGRKPGRPKKS